MGTLADATRIILVLAAMLCISTDVGAFPHITRKGETVAQIAERMYGRVELERVIVAANGLDSRSGTAIVAGMRLQLPALGYHRVLPGESWQTIASEHLGLAARGEVLSRVNDSHPWLKPEIGLEVIIPYSLRFVAAQGDTIQMVAYKFLGHRDKAWVIASYNGLKRARLRQGEVLLIPLSDLQLTEAGRRSALSAGALIRSQAGGAARQAQQRAENEIPRLTLDIRRGRWVSAIRRGASLLSTEGLSRPQLALVYRLLTEAYVALDTIGLATTACAKWAEADPARVLDPIDVSPKIMRACVGQGAVEGPVDVRRPDGGS